MKPYLARIATVIAVAGSASACDKIMGSSAPPPTAAPTASYEAVSTKGSPQEPGGLIRINITTGQTMVAYDNQATLIPVADTPAVPNGIYHVYVWSVVNQSSSDVTWNAERMDAVSGRIWRLLGDGNTTPFSWSEQTPAAKL